MRYFLNRFIHFEATPDGEAAIGGGEPEPVAAAPETPAPEAPAPEAAPQIDFSDPAIQQAIAEQAGYAAQQQLEQFLSQLPPGEEQAPEPFDLIGMEPEQQMGALGDFFGKMLDERLAPLMQAHERQQISDAEGYVKGTIEQLPEVAAVSEFLPTPAEGQPDTRSEEAANLIHLVGTGFLANAEDQYGGPGPQAVQAALRAGAAHVQQTLKQAYEAGRASLTADRERIAGASELPSGAAVTQIADGPKDEFEAGRLWLERQRST